MKRGIVFPFFVALTLVALLGNPFAFNPLASEPIIQEAYADNTKFLGSERGDTFSKEYYQDGNRVLVEHKFGLPKLIEDNGKYVPFVNEDFKIITEHGSVKLNNDGTFSYFKSGKQNKNVFLFNDTIVSKYADVSDLNTWSYLGQINNANATISFDGNTLTSSKVENGTGLVEYKYILNNGSWKTQLEATNYTPLTTKAFGFDQIIDLKSDSIKFGGVTRNLDNFDGQTFDKTFLENNEGKVLDLLNGFNFDFDLGFENLHSITVYDTGVNSSQLVFDYRTTTALLPNETLIIDPEFTTTETASGRLYGVGQTGTTCGSYAAASAHYQIKAQDTTDGGLGSCAVLYMQYDLSSLDLSGGKQIISGEIEYDLVTNTNLATNDCDLLVSSTNTLGSTMYNEGISYGTTQTAEAVANETWDCNQSVADNYTVDINAGFDTIESKAGGTITFLGVLDDYTRTGVLRFHGSDLDLDLTLTYVIPIVPNVATNDGVTSTTDLQYDWTYGTNFDNATQPAITNSSVWVGDTGYPQLPLANWNATQDTKVGGITTSSNFEGLFHFDSIVNELGYTDDWTGTDDWNDQDSSKTSVDTINDEFDFEMGSVSGASNYSSDYDLGYTIPTGTDNWNLKFKDIQLSSITSHANQFTWWGIGDSDSSVSRLTNQDFIGCIIADDGTNDTLDAYVRDSSNLQGLAGTEITGGEWLVSTSYNLEIDKDGDNLTCNLYSDTDFTTLIISDTTTGASSATVDGLQYLKLQNLDDAGAGTWTGTYQEIIFTDSSGDEFIYDYSGDDNHGTVTVGLDTSSLSTIGDDYKVIDSGTNATTGTIDLIPSGDFGALTNTISWSVINTGSSAGSNMQYHTSNHVNTSGAIHNSESYNTSCTYGVGTKGWSATIDLTEIGTIDYYYKITTQNNVSLKFDVNSVNKKTYSAVQSSYIADSIDVSDVTGSVLVEIYADRAACGVNRSIESYISELRFSPPSTAEINTSSINSGLTNEIQFNNAGLNVTSTSYPELQQEWTINALITLNQTDPFTFLSFDSGSEILLNLDDSFIALSKGGTDIFNHTLTTALGEDKPQAITIKRSLTGVYETFVNGTRSPDSATTDTTTLGTVTGDLYHIGYDTSLVNYGSWRLDELSILSVEQSDQDDIDFGNRLNPFDFQASVTQPTTTYTHTGLAAQTDKCFYVTIWNSAGESDRSGVECGLTVEPTPSQPTNLVATASSESVIGLDWDDSAIPTIDNITGYRIFMESPVGNGWTLEVNDTGTTTSSYSDTGLTTKTQYNYMVAGINATGVGSNSTASSTYTWGVPDDITGFTIINPTVDTLDLNYTAAVPYGYPVTGYIVYRDNVLLSSDIGNVTSYTDTGLAAVTSYEYSVKAISSFGNSATWVNATGTTVTSPPTSLTVNDGYHTLTTQLNLEWVAPVPSTGINGYKIEHESPISSGWSTLVANTTTTTLYYNHTGLATDGVFHNYRIYALTPDGQSAVSNTYAYTTHKLPYSVDDLVVTTNALLQFILNWSAPDLHGTLSGYMINYTTPAGDPTTVFVADTGNALTTSTLSGFDPTVETSFRVSAVTTHGANSTLGNISNGTLTSEIEIGDLDVAVAVNSDVVPIWYVLENVDANTDDVKVYFKPSLGDVDCTVTQRNTGASTSYPAVSETVDGSNVYHTFTITNAGNAVALDFDCWDSTDLTINEQYALTQADSASTLGGFGNVPMFSLMANFTSGLYGTEGSFAGIDLVTLFIVIISMLFFNRTNPALGVGGMAMMLGVAWYFEIIPWTSGVLGGIAVVIVLAIGQGWKNR